MRKLPWHVAVRADRKAILTAGAIGLGVAFALSSFAVPAALRTETIDPSGPFGRPDLLVARSDGATFDPRGLDIPLVLSVVVVPSRLADGSPVTLAALVGEGAPDVERGMARPGSAAHPWGEKVEHASGLALPIAEPIASPFVSRSWLVVHPSTLRDLEPVPPEHVSYVVVRGLSAADATRLRDAGYAIASVPGVEGFFRQSSLEVAYDLMLIVAFSSVLVALFAHEFVRTEIRDRRREIGLWRALGMRSGEVSALLVGRAAAVTLAGIVVGIGLSAASLLGAQRVFDLALLGAWIDARTGILVPLVFGAAGTLGALLPAFQAGRTSAGELLAASP